MSLKAEYEGFKEARRVEDMLVVKLDVSTVNDSMLKQAKLEEIEKEKGLLEQKIRELSQ